MNESKLKGKLLLADRGYKSEKLEKELIDQDVKFCIKGKKSMASEIVLEAFGSNGQRYDQYIGKPYAEIKNAVDDPILDVTVKNKEGDEIRIVRKKSNSNGDRKNGENSHPYLYLRTNIKREELSAKELFQLYRLRWQVEFFFCCLKQGNCLKSINSNNKNIILIFLLLGIMSALIKLYMTINTAKKAQKNLIDYSLLKVSFKPMIFTDLFENLCIVGKSKFYEIIIDINEQINEYCQKGEPSERDAALFKDYRLIYQDLVQDLN